MRIFTTLIATATVIFSSNSALASILVFEGESLALATAIAHMSPELHKIIEPTDKLGMVTASTLPYNESNFITIYELQVCRATPEPAPCNEKGYIFIKDIYQRGVASPMHNYTSWFKPTVPNP